MKPQFFHSFLVLLICLTFCHKALAITCPGIFDESALSSFDLGIEYSARVASSIRDAKWDGYDENVLDINQFMEDSGASFNLLFREREIISHSPMAMIEKIARDLVFTQGVLHGLLNEISQDPKLHRSLSDYFGKVRLTADGIHRDAKQVLAYRFLKSVQRRRFLSNRDFAELARIEDFPLKTYNFLYRIDSREFSEIAADNGFYPNPSIRFGTLFEHSKPGAGSSGAGFVSTSTQPGNEFNISKVWPVIAASRPVEVTDSIRASFKTQLENIPVRHEPNMVFQTEIRTTTEYRLKSLAGVDGSAGILAEKEVVIPFASLDSISEQRKILLLTITRRHKDSADILSIEVLEVKIEDWRKL